MAFLWDRANQTHIAAHGISPVEVEQVMNAKPVQAKIERRGGEDRYVYIGPTAAGRLLVVVVTPRLGCIRPVTAFPANDAMRRRYAEFISGESQ